MILWARVSELRDEIGAEDFDEVVEIFMEEVEEVVGKLRVLTDRQSLEQELHFLKGSALNLGFEGFSQLCQQGETQAAQGQAEEVDVSAILSSFEQSKTEFLSRLDGWPQG